MRTLFSLCALLLVCACSTDVGASRLIEMKVIDRQHGQPYATYYQAGKRYVAGNPGERYAIRLSNRSAERVLAVLSVDGVNAISGETAGTQQSGYVLAPYASVEIAGWRKSESEVAQFYFTALPDSYAARTGRPENVGVIGVAAFREKSQPQPIVIAPEAKYQEQDAHGAARKAAPASTLGASADSAARERLGTGHGAREYAPVTSVEFERRSTSPDQIVTLFYDSRVNLIARGIVPRPTPYHPPHHTPQAFPQGFVPDPS
jgi:hypothetical protein